MPVYGFSMISIETIPEGIRLGFWLGHGWHWEQFDNMDDLWIYAHKHGICLEDCDILKKKVAA